MFGRVNESDLRLFDDGGKGGRRTRVNGEYILNSVARQNKPRGASYGHRGATATRQ